MPEAITETTAQRVIADLSAKFGLIISYKSGTLYTIVGGGFTVAHAFGAGVPDGDTWRQSIATMIPLIPLDGYPSALVLLPPESPSPAATIHRVAHEAMHAHQFRNPAPGYDAILWGGTYIVNQEFRAVQEAGGFAVNAAIHWACGDAIPRADEYAHTATNTYALRPQDVELAARLYDIDRVAIERGLVRSAVSRRVLRRLYEVQPDCLTTQAQEIIEGYPPCN